MDTYGRRLELTPRMRIQIQGMGGKVLWKRDYIE
jgi:hypothetical protein